MTAPTSAIPAVNDANLRKIDARALQQYLDDAQSCLAPLIDTGRRYRVAANDVEIFRAVQALCAQAGAPPPHPPLRKPPWNKPHDGATLSFLTLFAAGLTGPSDGKGEDVRRPATERLSQALRSYKPGEFITLSFDADAVFQKHHDLLNGALPDAAARYRRAAELSVLMRRVADTSLTQRKLPPAMQAPPSLAVKTPDPRPLQRSAYFYFCAAWRTTAEDGRLIPFAEIVGPQRDGIRLQDDNELGLLVHQLSRLIRYDLAKSAAWKVRHFRRAIVLVRSWLAAAVATTGDGADLRDRIAETLAFVDDKRATPGVDRDSVAAFILRSDDQQPSLISPPDDIKAVWQARDELRHQNIKGRKDKAAWMKVNKKREIDNPNMAGNNAKNVIYLEAHEWWKKGW